MSRLTCPTMTGLQGARGLVELTFAFSKMAGDLESRSATLCEAERLYMNLVEQLPVVVYLMEPEQAMPMVFVSAHIEELTGFSPAEWLEDPRFWKQRIHPDDLEIVLEESALRIVRGTSLEYRLIARDGRHVWVRDECSVISVGELRFIQGILRDITEQKRAQGDLGQAKLILESVADGILGLDKSGAVTFVNPAAIKMLGWEKEELVGKNLHGLVHHSKPDGTPCSEDECFICCPTNVTFFDMDEVFWRKDGSCFPVEPVSTPVDEEGQTVGTVIVFKDVTERRQAEKERAQLATAIEQAGESVIITDSNGKIQYVNPAFERISGYCREEVIGRNPKLLRSGRHDGDFYKGMWDTIRAGEIWTGNLVNRKKDASLYELEATISPIRDKYGRITNFVAVRRDVTAENRLEKQLRQLQKMEAIGTLAGGIAHDFNNVLMAIFGYAELALSKVKEDGPLGANLREVLNAGERARNLIKQILTFSRQREQNLSPAKISPIVKETIEFLRASLPSRIEIRKQIETEHDVVEADPTQIHQVVMNICTNAGHAMWDTGGVLEIKMAPFELGVEKVAGFDDLAPGSYLKLTISDTGHGMDQATMDRIFDPFFTTKGHGEGTGLGLSVAHGIVESHGGKINVHSEPGAGSTFTIVLPTSDEEVRAEPESAKKPLPGGTERILLVDDEESIIDILGQVLKNQGYTVVTRSNGAEALRIFKEAPGMCDIVLTDHTMPKISGIELAKEILGIRPDIPVVLCTGFSDMEADKKARAAGIREVMMKPVTGRQLVETIRRVLDERC